MSDLAEKLEQRRPSSAGRAQAPRKHLLGRWGAREAGPDCIVIHTIGGIERWRRVDGDTFEQEQRS